MKRAKIAWFRSVAAALILVCGSALAADAPADKAAPKATAGAAAAIANAETKGQAAQPAALAPAEPAADKNPKPIPTGQSPYRKLAPWVMRTVDPMRSLGETVSYHNAVEILAADSKLSWAKETAYRRDVWTLEFKFKPVRMIWIDEPTAGGHMVRKLIWYMVYSVTNPGKVYHPVEDAKLQYATTEGKQLYQIKEEDRPVRFVPEFAMDTYQRTADGGTTYKSYPDRVIPVAMAAIRMREDPNRHFLTTVEMCRDIAVGETLWGIATWEDIDLNTFRFSIYVAGLTNAYRWKDAPDAYKPGDPLLTGRKLERRLLKLNFWRPADKYFEHEEEIRYGVPGGLDYEWVYR